MKKVKVLASLAVLALSLNLNSPAFSVGQKKPMTASVKQTNEIVNVQYPKKYTRAYIESIRDEYKVVGNNEIFYVALDILKGTNGEFSRKAALGNNLTGKPIKIEFKDLSTINENYRNFDALGWKRGSRLYIYVNQKHSDAPAMALAALLSHEAVHQDEYNSLSEETYAWTMEAAAWTELTRLHPDYELGLQPLVQRENLLKKLLIKGNYANTYIKKTVYSNAGYQNLPETSPGFESL
jgi:hypothetical protein